MTESCRMTLKVLYTIDNGSTGSYLARSKYPKNVRVVEIPGSEDSRALRVGAVHLSHVLREICYNSPEVMDWNTMQASGLDYNLYFKDVCEVEEPLVSLGLLSKLYTKLFKRASEFNSAEDSSLISETDYDNGLELGSLENNADDDYDEADDDDGSLLVTGRVCSSLTSLLRRGCSNLSNSNSNKNSRRNTQSVESEARKVDDPETLEVKLRFSRVRAKLGSRRPSVNSSTAQSNISLPPPSQIRPQPTVVKPVRTMAKPTSVIGATTGAANKRQTNPMPAPKAKRTQSLPIWNLKQNTGTGFLRNSIAHKIYLADRHEQGMGSSALGSNNGSSPSNINELKSIDTNKAKYDDDVSKRFDFMLNKKKTGKNNVSASSEKKSKKANAVKSGNGTKKVTNSRPTSNNRKSSLGNIVVNSPAFNEMLNRPLNIQSTKHSPKMGNIAEIDDESNKENIPPSEHNMDVGHSLELLGFADMTMKADETNMWLNDLNSFGLENLESGNLIELGKPDSATPRDPNTCNTLPIAEVDSKEITLDVSPASHNSEQDEEFDDDDATSRIMSFSTPSDMKRASSNVKIMSSPVQKRSLPDKVNDEEERRMSKKQKNLPSSPSMLYQFNNDNSSASEEPHDVFTSLIHQHGSDDTDQFASTNLPFTKS